MVEKIFNSIRDYPLVIYSVVALCIFFILRIIKAYDKDIDCLYERTEDLPEIRNDIEWLEKTKKDK